MTNQAQLAVEESDIIFFLVDGRSGLIPQDQRIAQSLRESGKPTYLVVKSRGHVRSCEIRNSMSFAFR